METMQPQAPVQTAPTQPVQTPSTEKKKKTGWSDMKLWQKIVTVIIGILLLFVIYVMLDANKYRATVHVIEGEGKVGVNPTDKALDFGDLSLGTSSVRRVDMKNGTFMPMYVFMIKTGKIAELMKIDKNNFKLKGGENVKIEYTVYMPASAKINDTYNGRVYLFKIPTFWL